MNFLLFYFFHRALEDCREPWSAVRTVDKRTEMEVLANMDD